MIKLNLMFPLIIISLIFAPLAFAAVEPWAFVPLYALYFLGAASIYAKGENTHPNPLYKTLLPAVLAVAAIGALQVLTQAPINGPSHLLFTTWRLNTANSVMLWLFYAAVMYCASKAIKTPGQLSGLLWTLFGIGVIVALMGTLQRGEDNTLVYGLRRVAGHAFGPFVNRDHGAFFLAMSGMCGLGLFVGGFSPLFRHQSHTKLFDLLAIQFLKFVMLAAVIAGIIKTGSRGGLNAFIFSAAFMGFASSGFLKNKAQKIAAWAMILVLLAGYGYVLSENRILLGLSGDKFDSSVAIRFSLYKSSWTMFKDFPVFGTGLGAVEHAFPNYTRADLLDPSLVRHVHSDWIELFLQVGLVGGLIYLAGLFIALYIYYKAWTRCHSFTIKAVYGGALGAALAGMLHSFVDFGLQMPANSLVFYALLGALASKPAVEGRRRLPHEEEEELEPTPPQKVFVNAAAVLALVLAVAAVPQGLSWYYNQQSKTGSYEEKVQARSAVHKWQPGPQAAFLLAAEYYNHALTDKEGPCALFRTSNTTAWPYLHQAPANSGLNLLSANLRLQLANCYNRPLTLKNSPKKPPPAVPPTQNSSRP